MRDSLLQRGYVSLVPEADIGGYLFDHLVGVLQEPL